MTHQPDYESFAHYPANPAPTSVRLHLFDEHPCSYLPNRTARMRGVVAGRATPEVYHAFMDAGFRRSGRLIYQPVCRSCRACRPLRVCVDRFLPNKSQRRCWRRNGDLIVTIGTPVSDDEAYEIYQRYKSQWHGRTDAEANESDERQAFESFLYDSPVNTVEFRYRESNGRLLAVGICDLSDTSLSSVYFYFDPDAADRSLGTFGAMREIEFARAKSISYYYLGYWIAACAAMSYKARFQPFELLHDDGIWREPSPPGSSG